MTRLAPLLLVLLAACDRAAPTAPQPRPTQTTPAPKPLRDNGIIDRSQAGLPAPDAKFRDPEGEAVSIAEFAGGPVLLNLWATWCAPCVAELPTLDALAGREAGTLSVITVSQDSDDDTQTAAEKVDAFFTARKFKQLGAYIDPESNIMTQLGVQILPTTILYDARGKEVWRLTGELDWTGARARSLLREAR